MASIARGRRPLAALGSRQRLDAPEALCRLCAVPVVGVLESNWDLGSGLMEMRILRPLVWFGLLQSGVEENSTGGVIKRRAYRKTLLFDRFLKFDVQIEVPGQRH